MPSEAKQGGAQNAASQSQLYYPIMSAGEMSAVGLPVNLSTTKPGDPGLTFPNDGPFALLKYFGKQADFFAAHKEDCLGGGAAGSDGTKAGSDSAEAGYSGTEDSVLEGVSSDIYGLAAQDQVAGFIHSLVESKLHWVNCFFNKSFQANAEESKESQDAKVKILIEMKENPFSIGMPATPLLIALLQEVVSVLGAHGHHLSNPLCRLVQHVEKFFPSRAAIDTHKNQQHAKSLIKAFMLDVIALEQTLSCVESNFFNSLCSSALKLSDSNNLSNEIKRRLEILPAALLRSKFILLFYHVISYLNDRVSYEYSQQCALLYEKGSLEATAAVRCNAVTLELMRVYSEQLSLLERFLHEPAHAAKKALDAVEGTVNEIPAAVLQLYAAAHVVMRFHGSASKEQAIAVAKDQLDVLPNDTINSKQLAAVKESIAGYYDKLVSRKLGRDVVPGIDYKALFVGLRLLSSGNVDSSIGANRVQVTSSLITAACNLNAWLSFVCPNKKDLSDFIENLDSCIKSLLYSFASNVGDADKLLKLDNLGESPYVQQVVRILQPKLSKGKGATVVIPAAEQEQLLFFLAYALYQTLENVCALAESGAVKALSDLLGLCYRRSSFGVTKVSNGEGASLTMLAQGTLASMYDQLCIKRNQQLQQYASKGDSVDKIKEELSEFYCGFLHNISLDFRGAENRTDFCKKILAHLADGRNNLLKVISCNGIYLAGSVDHSSEVTRILQVFLDDLICLLISALTRSYMPPGPYYKFSEDKSMLDFIDGFATPVPNSLRSATLFGLHKYAGNQAAVKLLKKSMLKKSALVDSSVMKDNGLYLYFAGEGKWEVRAAHCLRKNGLAAWAHKDRGGKEASSQNSVLTCACRALMADPQAKVGNPPATVSNFSFLGHRESKLARTSMTLSSSVSGDLVSSSSDYEGSSSGYSSGYSSGI